MTKDEQKEQLEKIIMKIRKINKGNTDALETYKSHANVRKYEYCEICTNFDYYDCDGVIDKNNEIDDLLNEIEGALEL